MKKLLSLGLAAWYIAPLMGCASQQVGDDSQRQDRMAKRRAMNGGYDPQAPPTPTAQDLLSAAARGDSLKIDALISQGIDINVRNANGSSALRLAASGGYMNAVQSLIAGGADVNAADNNGTTPLMAAAQAGFDDVVKALKTAGARGAQPSQQPASGATDNAWWKN